MGKSVYNIYIVFIVLFYLFIGNLILKQDTRNVADVVELADLGCTWSHVNISGWAKMDANGVANSEDEAYIVLEDVVYTPTWATWQDSIRRMEDYFEKRGGSPIVSSTLVGYCDNRLDKREKRELCMSILKRIGASKIEVMEDEELISMTGYTSIIEDSYKTPKGPVNVNVAARYNSFEDKTYIFLGTPIITIEY